jgi:rhamnopyranosyl-N-acetylglucosaminyl-diphospho-decaprenol beta-1,3/1,4-galactofuranosyltransferase
MKSNKIAAVVVTYNRKHDLIICLESIFKQSKTVDALYIIDNKSNDGTPEFLLENHILKRLPLLSSNKDEIYTEIKTLQNGKEIELNYVRKCKNDGGAGGFYKGMKLVYESNYDWIWLMDDDGMADTEQLNNLVTFSEENNIEYANALVLNNVNKNKLAFGLKGYKNIEDIKEQHYIEGYVNPFNGTFIAKRVIDKIGLIKKEMFIWGDESEYTSRVRKNDFKIVTVLDAIHYHPMNKGITKKVFPFSNKFKIIVKPVHLEHIYFRNLGYLEKLYGNKKIRILSRFTYISYFILNFRFVRAFKFLKHYSKGVRNEFS